MQPAIRKNFSVGLLVVSGMVYMLLGALLFITRVSVWLDLVSFVAGAGLVLIGLVAYKTSSHKELNRLVLYGYVVIILLTTAIFYIVTKLPLY